MFRPDERASTIIVLFYYIIEDDELSEMSDMMRHAILIDHRQPKQKCSPPLQKRKEKEKKGKYQKQ